MSKLCLRLPNVDRIGLVHDISMLLASLNLNIISMEVDVSIVYLCISPIGHTNKNYIIDKLSNIPSIISVQEIELMPHEEQSDHLRAILSSINDGIVVIDKNMYITNYNYAAEKITKLTAKDVIGKLVTEVFPPEVPIVDAFKSGQIFSNREIMIDTPKNHYLVSCRPLLDDFKNKIGAIAILKDIREVRELVHSLTSYKALTFEEIFYISPVMKRVISLAKSIAKGSSTVLIRGETGTGKELFARAIQSSSPRSKNPFITINCAAIPDTLLESELFGYDDGSFTGAIKGGKQGLFEFSHGGTIFLDEIGELSTHLQAKLLRVLQEGKVRRIGSTREINVDVRVIAATSRNIEDMIEKGRFREDLFYRLNVIPVYLPPLRSRKEDIPILTNFFLGRFSQILKQHVNIISEDAMNKLLQYDWPGNIRELENIIERAVNIIDGDIILAEHIIFDQDCITTLVPITQTLRPIKTVVEEAEKNLLENALKVHKNSRALGRVLGLSHTAILKKLHKFKLLDKLHF